MTERRRRQHAPLHGRHRLRRHQQAALQRARHRSTTRRTRRSRRASAPSAAPRIRPDLGISQTSGNTFPANFVVRRPEPQRDGASTAASRRKARSASPRPPARRRRCRRSAARTSPRCWTSTRRRSARASSRARPCRSPTTTRRSSSTTCRKNEVTFASSETPVNDFNGTGADPLSGRRPLLPDRRCTCPATAP